MGTLCHFDLGRQLAAFFAYRKEVNGVEERVSIVVLQFYEFREPIVFVQRSRDCNESGTFEFQERRYGFVKEVLLYVRRFVYENEIAPTSFRGLVKLEPINTRKPSPRKELGKKIK